MKAKQIGLYGVAALGAGILLTLLIWLLARPSAPVPAFVMPTAASPQTQPQAIDPTLGQIIRARQSQLSQLGTPVVREVTPFPLTMLGLSEATKAASQDTP
ncbi:MAG: hypothetical protein HQL86_05800 [Magnetococcales bacterium]|nr:hypothetical protein [Magnetococcales bacterium]